jgi:FKBP-type peptidyl-prolyl cis-trans isomerase FklB
MKRITLLLVASTGLLYTQAQHSHTPMTTELDSLSYAVGINIAASIKNGGIDSLNMELYTEAMNDILRYNHTKMDAQMANQIVNNYIAKLQAKKQEEANAEGIAFLQANAAKKGVKSTPSGLQYKVITEGTGDKPIDGQQVKTHYSGTLINGKKFDSSYDRGEPATFGVNQVIPGWTEALKMMTVGSKWELYIPYDLAYGERGMGANIPPYSTLIFTIELLEIVQ